MVRRPLGRTGLSISPIALGTTKLGRNTDVKYPFPFALPSDREVAALLDCARAAGVNLIDTAPAYGESERRLGRLIKGYRHEVVLCTKCGERYADGLSSYDFSARAIIASAEQSLRNLRTEYVDILLLHSDGRDLEILTQTDALSGLTRLKETGKIRAAGISAKTIDGVLEACHALEVVMAPFSQEETALAEALGEAHLRGMGVLAIKGLQSGYLQAGRAIDFVLCRPFIDALVVGTINPKHLAEAVAAAERVRGAV